jgi:hypothetical protein
MQNGTLKDWGEHQAGQKSALRRSSESGPSVKGMVSASGRAPLSTSGAQPALIRSSAAFKEFVASHDQRDTVRTVTPVAASHDPSRSRSAEPPAERSSPGTREPSFGGGMAETSATSMGPPPARAGSLTSQVSRGAGAGSAAMAAASSSRRTRGRSPPPAASNPSSAGARAHAVSAAFPSSRPSDLLDRFDKLLTTAATVNRAPPAPSAEQAAVTAQHAAMMEQMHTMLTALTTQVTTALEALEKRIAALERKSAQPPAPAKSPCGPSTLITNPYFNQSDHPSSPTHTDPDGNAGDSDGATAAALRSSHQRSLSAAAQYRTPSRERRPNGGGGGSPLALEESWGSSSRPGVPRQADLDTRQRGETAQGSRSGPRRSASLQPGARPAWYAAAEAADNSGQRNQSQWRQPGSSGMHAQPRAASAPEIQPASVPSPRTPRGAAQAILSQQSAPRERQLPSPQRSASAVPRHESSSTVQESPYEDAQETELLTDTTLLEANEGLPAAHARTDTTMAIMGSPMPSARQQVPIVAASSAGSPSASPAPNFATEPPPALPQVPSDAPQPSMFGSAVLEDSGNGSSHSRSSGRSSSRRLRQDAALDQAVSELLKARDEGELLRFVQQTPPCWASLSAGTAQLLLQFMCKCGFHYTL